MTSSSLLALLLGVASAEGLSEADQEFLKFVAQHGRSYGTREEFEFRAAIFKENYEYIEKVNAEDKGLTLAVNFLADRTDSEMKKYTGYRSDLEGPREEPSSTPDLSPVNALDNVDYRDDGAVTSVKNQGECGSSWAFSVVAPMEAYNYWNTGELVTLSPQNLMDCSKYDHGCEGGIMAQTYGYLWKDGCLMSEADYPYQGIDRNECDFDPSKMKTKISDTAPIVPQTWTSFMSSMDIRVGGGPLSLGVSADSKAFRFYKSGILQADKCGSENLTHGVASVGYKTVSKDPSAPCGVYAIVKNSWGTEWGLDGYGHVCITDNACGILLRGDYPPYKPQ